MNLLHIFLILPGILLIYALYRLASGRPLQKRVLNIVSALILMIFFFMTAGLGIFWVANQELPVFDIHYLFGYATLAMVLVHLIFNWKAITIFFQKFSPKILLEEGERTWRPAVKFASWAIGLTLYGSVTFWLGLRQGSSRIEILMPEPSTASLSQPGENVKAAVPVLTPASHQIIKDGDKKRVLADYYHEKTKHTRRSVMSKSGGLDWSTQPKVFKRYSGAEVVSLPEPRQASGLSIGQAIDAGRGTTGAFTPSTVSLVDLSTILFMTNGVTGELSYPGHTYYLRAAPSAGALYPGVTYVLIQNVQGMAPGLYHYAVKRHELHRIRLGETLNEDLSALVAHNQFVENAHVTFIFTSIFFRSSWKYGERSYRYSLLDVGHLAVQTGLAANALGYNNQFIGRFDDAKVNAFLELDEDKEGALMMVSISNPLGVSSKIGDQQVFVPNRVSVGSDKNPLLALMHGSTYLRASGSLASPYTSRELPDKAYPNLPKIDLPKQFLEGDDLIPTIQRRRSARKWGKRGMTIKQLSSVLYYTFGIRHEKEESFPDASLEDNNALNLYIVVNNVRGLDSGVYYYRRHDHALSLIQKGDYRRKSYEISLFQQVVGYSDVELIMTIDLDRFGYPDADRGYRYAVMDAGMLGGRLYLQTVGLGLGCTGIGAFFDDEVSDVIHVSPEKELVIYTAAIGVKAEGFLR